MPSPPYLPTLLREAALRQARLPRPTDGYIHASSLGPNAKRCDKRLQFEYLLADVHETNATDVTAIALLLGTSVHAAIDALMGDISLSTETNVQLWDDKLFLAGSADHIIRDAEGVPWIVEVKTVAEEQYRYLKNPLPRHIWQVHAYMLMAGVAGAILYYLPKGDPAHTKDPSTHLRRAVRGLEDLDLKGQIERFLLHNAGKAPVADTEIGRQFVVPRDGAVILEIERLCEEVMRASGEQRWLPANQDLCSLCPFVQPCWRGDTIEQINHRQKEE